MQGLPLDLNTVRIAVYAFQCSLRFFFYHVYALQPSGKAPPKLQTSLLKMFLLHAADVCRHPYVELVRGGIARDNWLDPELMSDEQLVELLS